MADEKRIVEKCIRLFNTKGIKTSMDELAASLKMSKRTIYERFSSKFELIQFVLDYYSSYLDTEYKEIMNNLLLNDYEKLEAIFNIIPKELCFSEEQKKSLKVSYPEIYNEYQKRTEVRWRKTMLIVDKLISNDYSKNINKELFKLLYISSIESIAKKCATEDEFNMYKRGLSNLLIKAIQSSTPIVTGGIKLLDLLAKFSIGVLIFSYVDGVMPIYMSHGYYSLFEDENKHTNSDLLERVHEDDRDQYISIIENGINNNTNIQFEYRYKTNKGYKWHKTRCIPIEYEGYKNVFLAVVSDTTESHIRENELNLEKERLALAFEQTNISIWEYDVKCKKLVLSDALAKLYGYTHTVISDAPRSVISSQMVHNTSIKVYEEFYNDIICGKETGSCTIQHKDYEGKYRWIKLSYRTIFEDNKPVKAIGIIEKQDNVVEVINKFEQEKSIVKLLEKELLVTIQYNVSKNKVSDLYVNSNLEYNFIDKCDTYQQFFDEVMNHIGNKEDKQQFDYLFNEYQLNEYFEISKSSKHLNYRSIDSNGRIKWHSFTVNFLYEPFTGDRYIFGYIRDIDHKMKLELELDRKVEYDLITRVYIEQVMKKITNYAISKNTSNDKCCFAIIDIENFNHLKRLYGLDGAEKILFHIGRILRICFNNKYIVGRIPEQQFGIFIPIVKDELEIKRLIEDTIITAINSYSLSADNSEKTKVNLSIYFAQIKRATYEKLYNNCSLQLNRVNKTDEFLNVIDNINEMIDEETIHEVYDTTSQGSEFGDMINSITKNIMFVKSNDEVVKYILKTINNYYGSFKTSIFQNYQNKYYITYEYTIGDIYEFDNFSIDLNEFPAINLIDKYKKLAIVNNIETIRNKYPDEYKLLKRFNIYSILLVPLISNNEVNGYLAISNQTKNVNDKDMATTLSYFISKELEQKKVLEEEQYLEKYDLVSSLQNYRMFRKKIELLKKNAISSLGIVCIKIDEYKELTFDYGDTFVNDLIIKLSNVLRKHFLKNKLFRYDNDTFYIISVDSEYQKFKKKVNLIIKEISKIRNGFARIGFTWSDVDLNVDLLLKHAEELMRLNKIDSEEESEELFETKLENLDEALNLNWFEVYLQPKFKIDGTIYGAEALLRINHPEFGIISPASFIPLLEKEKLTGKVDLFVFEQVCILLRRWKAEKRKVLPVSVNYSRVTVLENGILKKTLALMKKYKIDPTLIEIEITESVGNLEKQTLVSIAKSFINNGIRLSLDDFGAEYSNLNTLATIPFYAVKLDKSLINDIVTNDRNQVLVENVILTCKKLNMLTVVEGVETELQYNEIKKYDCGLVQGYYFEKPIRIKDFEEKYNQLKTINNGIK